MEEKIWALRPDAGRQQQKPPLRFERAQNEILQLVLENTSISDFYCYPKERLVQCSERMMKHFGFPEYIEDACRFINGYALNSDAWDAEKEIYESLLASDGKICVEFIDKNKRCYKIMLMAIEYDEDKQPSFAIGIIEDITKSKELETALREAHTLDDITGFYINEVGIKKIRQYMEEVNAAHYSVMMILDMDNFKQINLEEGRVFADILLRETADIIRGHVDESDILVRLGGDELMLFIKKCDKERASVLGAAIAESIKEFCYNQENKKHFSASIGMCATSITNEYSALYRCAESTLQYVKAHGKGFAACYYDTSNELGTWLTQMYPNRHFLNSIDSSGKYSEENLADVALELLGKAKRLDDAINLLGAKLGKRYNLDRTSVVDIDSEFKKYSYTYQWSRKNPDLQLGEIHYFEDGQLETLLSSYDEDEICIQKHRVRGKLCSSLNCAVWSDGRCVGNYSFESFNPDYEWTAEHRKMLREISQIVSTFSLKARADAVSKAKTDFLSRMSHEIRTPMNAISGMTQIAKTVLDNKEKTLDCLNKIESSNQYLLNLINDILEMSRIESGKMELNQNWLLLYGLERQLDEMMTVQAEAKGLTLEFERDYPENWLVYLDPLRFNQVMINVIGNAIKFTKKGGRVKMSVKVLEQRGDSTSIRFSVKDTGIGIASDALKRIFNSFEQESSSTSFHYGGTGLGLAISSNLVRLMGGVLEVNSELSVGSEFYFTLPLLYKVIDVEQINQDRKIPDENDILEFDFTGKRLLIVEDNDLNREIIVELLKEKGFNLEEAEDGKKGLEAFLDHEPYYYDGVLMDVRMPVMDGLEATRQIRLSGKKDARDIPIIAMTANAFDEDAQKSIQSGMDGHLSKPLEMKLLLNTLAKCLCHN